MNRRGVGFAAALVAVGAIVRRRMKTQADPGPSAEEPEIRVPHLDLSLADPARAHDAVAADLALTVPVEAPVDQTVEATAAAPATAAAVQADEIADAVVVSASSDALDLHTDPAVPAGISIPFVDLPAAEQPALGDPDLGGQVDVSYDKVTSSDVELGQPDIGLPANESVPEASTPTIVLPSMPTAGTNQIVNPVAPATAPADVSSRLEDTEPPNDTEPSGTTGPSGTDGSSVDTSDPGAGSATSAFAGAHVPAEPSPPTAGDDAAPKSRRQRFGFWTILGGVVSVVVAIGLIAATVVPLPYYRLDPGSTYNTIERVDAPVDLVFIPEGKISFVTVSQRANINGWQWLDAKLDDNVRIRHEDEIRGDQTADELREADLRRMQLSKNSAVVVALQKLGYDLEITPIGVEVAEVFDCTAADGKLGTGDLIVGVNDVDVRDGETLVAELLGIGIGQDVQLLVERIDPNNPTQSMRTDLVGLQLGSADAACLPDDVRADEPRPFIGIGTLTIVEENFPIDVDIRTGTVSGPSAGLAFTLAIMDVLSEGELTNGLNIVATGTIDRDGNVGPVGGIHQKTVAAERAGADVFIVPLCCEDFVDSETGEPVELPSNYEEAVANADDMLVIGVNNIDEALAAIAGLGGDVSPFVVE